MTDENETNQFVADIGVDLESTAEVTLCFPQTGEPILDDKNKPWTITVMSARSKLYRRKANQIQARYKIIARNNTGPNKGTLTFEQEENYQAEIYAAAMVDWHIGVKPGAPPLKVAFTTKNAINWCKGNLLLREQIHAETDSLDGFLKDTEGNFTKKD